MVNGKYRGNVMKTERKTMDGTEGDYGKAKGNRKKGGCEGDVRRNRRCGAAVADKGTHKAV
jgi:hypothetical protein